MPAAYITFSRNHDRPTFEPALAKPGDWAWESWHAKPDAVVNEPPAFAPVPDDNAKPCPTCGAWFLWEAGDGWRHCVECTPPPTAAAVAKIVQCEVVDGKRHAVDVTAICLPLLRRRMARK